MTITIDTEPDNVWANHHSRGVLNVAELSKLQTLLDRYGARVTLLVTHEIITSQRAVEVLMELVNESGAEIGAHLHPWDNPPFLPSGQDRRYHTFPHELSVDHFRQKMEVLTQAIAARFPHPVCYRAGRYGFTAAHIPVLEELGYRVDSSVTPLCNWSQTIGLPRSEEGVGGVDCRNAPLDPYFPDYADACRPGDAALLEVPVTIYATRYLPDGLLRGLARLPEKMQGLIRRASGLCLTWLRPTGQVPNSVVPMLAAWQRRGPLALNMMFHSSELLVGGSPSTPTRAEVDAVFERIEEILTWLAGQAQFRFMTLGAAGESIRKDRTALSS